MTEVRTRGVAVFCALILSTLLWASGASAHAPTIGAEPLTVEST